MMSRLTCLETLTFEPFPHQIEAAWKVLFPMGGRALLADETGLGKTIEAGLIIKEYIHRGEAKKILILTPANLTGQWVQELREKFQVYFWVNKKDYGWAYYDLVAASLDLAKRKEHAEIIHQQRYDLVIIDEAHRLKNRRTANWQFVKNLSCKYLLLLTATPLQNDLKELFNLIELVRPGFLGDEEQFRETFMEDKRTVKNVETLQYILSKVMVRNLRSEVNIELPKRKVQLLPVELSDAEKALYNGVMSYLRDEYTRRKTANQSILSLLTLLREICSSSYAALATIEHMGLDSLIPLARAIDQNAKAKAVADFLKNTTDKVIIFTEYLKTQEYLYLFLREAGIPALLFNGDMSNWSRYWIQHAFRNQDFQVLISTESGGEGLNLQFCRQVINYDLPWNPMKLEQRIGRVHRLGQTRDVQVINLFGRGTIEEYMIRLLGEKIEMVEDTIGSLEHIISDRDSAQQEMVRAIWDEIRERNPHS